MAIPSFNRFFRPVLEAYGDGSEKRLREISDTMGEYFGLSEEEKQELVPSRRQTRLLNRVSWAKTYLTNTGLLRTTRRGYSKITEQGSSVLESGDDIDIEYLKRFDSFQEFQERGTEKSDDRNEALEVSDEHDFTPEENIERNFNSIKNILAEELLSRIYKESPQFFEKLIVDLLLKIGYGDMDGMGEITGGSGDDGVDGVIHQDRLGIDKIYLQAKRYAPENKITGKQIREFSGSLQQKQVKKGVFVTTSSFTDKALVAAKDLNITTVDANRLVDLMIKYNIGCQVDKTYEIKKVDLDYFEQD